MPILNAALGGAMVVSAWAIAVFFLRFWRRTRDPLFAFFAAAFALFALERIVILVSGSEIRPYIYFIRLAGFLLIMFAIYNKNRRARPGA